MKYRTVRFGSCCSLLFFIQKGVCERFMAHSLSLLTHKRKVGPFFCIIGRDLYNFCIIGRGTVDWAKILPDKPVPG